MNVSGLVLTKNEEKNIGDCLRSLSFCDELVVIDDGSIDATREIARKLGAKVYVKDLDGNFAAQRNFGLAKASGRWVLFLDADERIGNELREEITRELKKENNPFVGYYLFRQDCLWGKKLNYGETGSIKLLRLGRKSAGSFKRRVHETWGVMGRTGVLKNPIIHYPHPTLSEFIADINLHSTLHARANLEEKKKSTLLKILFFPKLKFLRNYILKLGFLDGERGFVHALLMSFHSFLAWSKLWILQRK